MNGSRTQEILAEVFAVGADTEASLPDLLCAACVRDLPVDGAGIALIDEHGVRLSLATTDERARLLEDLQITLGEGPCLDAFATGRPVSQPNLATGGNRWLQFGAAAVAGGVGAVFAFPLQLGGIRLGVLDLYRATPGELTDAETTEALAFSDAAMLMLLYLQNRAPPGRLPAEFDAAWMGQAEVHQATGMISVQAKLALADALVTLRARAFARGRSVADVASDVVARRMTFTDPVDDE